LDCIEVNHATSRIKNFPLYHIYFNGIDHEHVPVALFVGADMAPLPPGWDRGVENFARVEETAKPPSEDRILKDKVKLGLVCASGRDTTDEEITDVSRMLKNARKNKGRDP
jgi:hypothetical protein